MHILPTFEGDKSSWVEATLLSLPYSWAPQCNMQYCL